MGSGRAGTLDLWSPKGKDSVEDSFPGPGEGLCVLEISTEMGYGVARERWLRQLRALAAFVETLDQS